MKKSPLAPTRFPKLRPIAGVRLAVAESGIKYRDRDDLMLAAFAHGTTAAGVFTQSATAGAPVLWCKRCLLSHAPRALMVNAGNANVFTGEAGRRHVLATCQAVAAALDCAPEQTLVASTGVIGEPLPAGKIIGATPQLAASLGAHGWAQSAAAILTTDTFAKGATARAMIAGRAVTLNGFAKGSGMIEPNMATMLAFLFTDAAIPRPILQSLLATAVEPSFNAISVDSDTSTSDACMLFATGQAGNPMAAHADDPLLDDFRRALALVMTDLAVQVVRDGEGAQKLITVEIRGAETDGAAKIIAKSIANSPLVKIDIGGEDVNWGRIIMAIGKSGQRVDPARIRLSIGGALVTEHGRRIENADGAFDEAPLKQHLKGAEILLQVDLGLADGRARVWTCDLTHGYIYINAGYRT